MWSKDFFFFWWHWDFENFIQTGKSIQFAITRGEISREYSSIHAKPRLVQASLARPSAILLPSLLTCKKE